MLKKRLIVVLILRDGKVIQSVRFKHTNVIHWNPSIAVEFFDKWAADEIVVLDVSRNKNNRKLFYEVVSNLSKKCFVPLTVGGWIDGVEETRKVLRLGADKIAINTKAVINPEIISQLAEVFGSQCVVVSVDVKKHDGEYEVYINRGSEPTGLSPFNWAKKAQKSGAGEIFLNCIDRDGAREGFDLDLLRKVVESVEIPVIAMGGVFTWQHLVDGIIKGKADAVAAANIFHYTEHSAKKAKEFMKQAGIDMR
ncbi:MAG: Histidine biosynthesis protein [Candidatus Curtissbacteria bacterium GW2011_GWA1_40_47]|uniref:imidazole glycerol-phosphate synthase n=1 Tax=Candidatus Curtissbacteria bacterium RIFOXYA1_FULL_41_14 TaxID=1797737 RepID=A0A1F5HAW1_9BACT|nr:MAG: Histidine biosynthesis protein [Candidatus Curtissbacteria bacterium GW2011_GWB1_40_28]KKR62360.1 MAG: Histidine biosynthesis protein [Microgenomates group bacterium GW2011_GWC1_40_35]KKR66439.1 MAG: Histidine biosynthesis protein [Candidatus Curtissbacteria bacterium GW2011_GWA1_40_47]KKR77901.1 MAG: Histidine biosynthesis protein [Candidatus Curtissbacteria bacterium GW2011_GWD1_40_8]KKS02528.1 MAG: Histidine biosynthesis protein [Candidatus Curtissbacteria bacterium GW2011_GWC2_41_21